MRYLLIIITLLISSLVYAQECSLEACQKSTGLNCSKSGSNIYTVIRKSKKVLDLVSMRALCPPHAVGMTDGGNCYAYSDGSGLISPSPPMLYKDEEYEEKTLYCSIKPEKPELTEPDDPLFKEWQNCKKGKANRTANKTVGTSFGGSTHTGGNYETYFHCDEPPIDYTYKHPDEDNKKLDELNEPKNTCSGSACNFDDLKKLDDLTDVPCFGASCTTGDPKDDPTYQGNNGGVPCFSNTPDGCKNLAPDYVDPNTGNPCWGEFCSSNGKPPVSVDDKGNKCVGVYCEGVKGNMSDGSSVGGGSSSGGSSGNSGGSSTGNGKGEGTGNGKGNGKGEGTGNGKGDGKGEGDGNSPFDISFNAPDYEVAPLPATLWDKKESDTLEQIFTKEIEQANPYDFTSIDTKISGSGACPVFVFEFFGDISPPCEFWTVLNTIFKFMATLVAFFIIFWRR